MVIVSVALPADSKSVPPAKVNVLPLLIVWFEPPSPAAVNAIVGVLLTEP